MPRTAIDTRTGRADTRARVVRLFGLALVVLPAGCAGTLPPHKDQAISTAQPVPAGTPLEDIARRAGIERDATATWPMPESAFALDARLTAISRATTSIDIQTYLIADDATGREVLRALRDAAMRGVRARLLVDDIYTAGLDGLLMGLASHDSGSSRRPVWCACASPPRARDSRGARSTRKVARRRSNGSRTGTGGCACA